MFRHLCGAAALRNVILTTTFWDQVSDEVGSRREAQLISEFWAPMTQHGSRVARFYPSTYESAWDLINQFDTSTTLNPRPALQLQTEMVDEGKKLQETSAFRGLVRWWDEVVGKLRGMLQRREGQDIRQKLKQALKVKTRLEHGHLRRSPSIGSSIRSRLRDSEELPGGPRSDISFTSARV
jgi:hypothetical protein